MFRKKIIYMWVLFVCMFSWIRGVDTFLSHLDLSRSQTLKKIKIVSNSWVDVIDNTNADKDTLKWKDMMLCIKYLEDWANACKNKDEMVKSFFNEYLCDLKVLRMSIFAFSLKEALNNDKSYDVDTGDGYDSDFGDSSVPTDTLFQNSLMSLLIRKGLWEKEHGSNIPCEDRSVEQVYANNSKSIIWPKQYARSYALACKYFNTLRIEQQSWIGGLLSNLTLQSTFQSIVNNLLHKLAYDGFFADKEESMSSDILANVIASDSEMFEFQKYYPQGVRVFSITFAELCKRLAGIISSEVLQNDLVPSNEKDCVLIFNINALFQKYSKIKIPRTPLGAWIKNVDIYFKQDNAASYNDVVSISQKIQRQSSQELKDVMTIEPSFIEKHFDGSSSGWENWLALKECRKFWANRLSFEDSRLILGDGDLKKHIKRELALIAAVKRKMYYSTIENKGLSWINSILRLKAKVSLMQAKDLALGHVVPDGKKILEEQPKVIVSTSMGFKYKVYKGTVNAESIQGYIDLIKTEVTNIVRKYSDLEIFKQLEVKISVSNDDHCKIILYRNGSLEVDYVLSDDALKNELYSNVLSLKLEALIKRACLYQNFYEVLLGSFVLHYRNNSLSFVDEAVVIKNILEVPDSKDLQDLVDRGNTSVQELLIPIDVTAVDRALIAKVSVWDGNAQDLLTSRLKVSFEKLTSLSSRFRTAQSKKVSKNFLTDWLLNKQDFALLWCQDFDTYEIDKNTVPVINYYGIKAVFGYLYDWLRKAARENKKVRDNGAAGHYSLRAWNQDVVDKYYDLALCYKGSFKETATSLLPYVVLNPVFILELEKIHNFRDQKMRSILNSTTSPQGHVSIDDDDVVERAERIMQNLAND